MAEIKNVVLHMNGGVTITLNDKAAQGFLGNIDSDGEFKDKTLTFNNNDDLTEEIIFTRNIAFAKINYK